MNRPPTPYETGSIHTYGDLDEMYYMQEALTVEWLIEHGLMPDPTDFKYYTWTEMESIYGYWPLMDKDPDGKPSDYEVKK